MVNLPAGGVERKVYTWDLLLDKVFLQSSFRVGHWSSMPVISLPSYSVDGKFMLTYENNSTHIRSLPSGTEVARLMAVDSVDWVVTTTDGLFDASPGALNRMHYVVNYKQEWEIIELDQLKTRYYEPGLLQKVMGFSDERIRPVVKFDTVALYPRVAAEIIQDTLWVRLEERNGGIGKISLFINGKEVIHEANPLPRGVGTKRDHEFHYELGKARNYFYQNPDSINHIEIRAFNEAGWLKSRPFNLEYQISGRAKGQDRESNRSGSSSRLARPKLFMVCIGTSDYAGSNLDLQYADQDAKIMAKALFSVGNVLVAERDSLEVFCLNTTPADSMVFSNTPIVWQYATKDSIRSVFRQIKQEAKAEDVLIVYLSGHGVTYGSSGQAQFHYLTEGIASEDLSDTYIRDSYTISSEELTHWINGIPALKQVLMIDACNSGQIIENLMGGAKALNSSQIRALDRMQDRTGMFILSGSAADKLSYEASEYGQGLLTYALLKGILGVATRKTSKGEFVDVMKLFQYVRDEVPRLAASINGIQTPMMGFPKGGSSFDIGMLDQKIDSTLLGNKKPVFVQSVFLNQSAYKDDLMLGQELELALRAESEKGKNAEIIYIDVANYPGAYSIGGFYVLKDGQYYLKAKLFRGEEALKDLQIPPANNAREMVNEILWVVMETLDELPDR